MYGESDDEDRRYPAPPAEDEEEEEEEDEVIDDDDEEMGKETNNRDEETGDQTMAGQTTLGLEEGDATIADQTMDPAPSRSSRTTPLRGGSAGPTRSALKKSPTPGPVRNLDELNPGCGQIYSNAPDDRM